MYLSLDKWMGKQFKGRYYTVFELIYEQDGSFHLPIKWKIESKVQVKSLKEQARMLVY